MTFYKSIFSATILTFFVSFQACGIHSTKDENAAQYARHMATVKALQNDGKLSDPYKYHKFDGLSDLCATPIRPGAGKISIVDEDCLVTATRNNPSDTCVLIAGNKTSAGGGVVAGTYAQEEAIYHHTSMPNHHRNIRGLLPEFGGVYIYGASIVRDPITHDMFDAPFNQCDFVSMAGYRLSSGRSDKADMPSKAEFPDKMDGKLRALLSACVHGQKRHLVLGAIGSGAFATDRQTGEWQEWIARGVAQSFHRVLNEIIPGERTPYANAFDTITFSILGKGLTVQKLRDIYMEELITAPAPLPKPSAAHSGAGAAAGDDDPYAMYYSSTPVAPIVHDRITPDMLDSFAQRSVQPGDVHSFDGNDTFAGRLGNILKGYGHSNTYVLLDTLKMSRAYHQPWVYSITDAGHNRVDMLVSIPTIHDASQLEIYKVRVNKRYISDKVKRAV